MNSCTSELAAETGVGGGAVGGRLGPKREAGWEARQCHHPLAWPFQSSRARCKPHFWLSLQKPPRRAPNAQNELGHKEPFERAKGNAPLGSQVDSKRSLSITNEFRDRATPGGTPSSPKSQTQPAHSFENQTCFPRPPPSLFTNTFTSA